MAAHALRNEEMAGLALALVAHAGLVAWLVLAPPRAEPLPPPERVAVTLSDERGPEATTPEPSKDPAGDGAPQLGMAPPPPAPEPVVEPAPPPPKSSLAIAQKPPPKQASKPPVTPPRKGESGASSFADMFKDGVPGGTGKGQSDAKPSAQQQSAIRVSINSQVLRPWNACSVTGIDIEKLRARVEFVLDRDGSIVSIGEPVVSGITPSNSPQARRFGECAVRAIRTAAPFDTLPREHYDFWKSRRLVFRKE
jgi:outer membrane biosynthesis protein TonB